ncbi:Sdh6p [Rhodotorula paludigena]|uniref:Sdh6p n=1 Tax=Rhodotorula paludigena TaxID=86838 RepID=UPI003170C8B6
MPPRRVTGLQRQVFGLYRRALHLVQSKPLKNRPAWFAFVSHQFRHPSLGGGLKRKDVSAIEHLLRRGDKMIETYGSPGVKNVVVPEDAHNWPQNWVAKGGKEGLGR